MRRLRVLLQMARADFLERTRRASFFVALAACATAGHGFLPPNPGPYATMQLGGHRGIYNSAWAGTLVALLSGVFLSLVGFYLIRNAIERDRRTGVGEILATTPLGRVQYTVGKTLSNFATLAAMTALIALAAAVVQVVRGEHATIEPWALGAPFVFLTLPVLLVTSAVAVLFETTPGLRGGFGNVAYFFVWSLTLAGSASLGDDLLRRGNDLLGTGLVIPSIAGACRAAFPDYDPATAGFSMGLTFRDGGWALTTFTWEGIPWGMADVGPRLVWVALALGIAVAAAVPFDRFDPARGRFGGAPSARRRRGTRGPRPDPSRDDAGPGFDSVSEPDTLRVELGHHASDPRSPRSGESPAIAASTRVTPLAPDALGGSPLSRFAARVAAEVKLTLRGTSRWWYVVWLVISGFAVGFPLETARMRVLPVLWIWPVLLWSPLGTRERRHGTDQILFSAPHPLGMQLAALWAAGAIVAVITGAPIAARLAWAGDVPGLWAWIVGAAFISALALALGVWAGTSRAFEAAYTLLWYAGPLQPIPALDFMGASREAVERGMPFVYLALTSLLLAAAAFGRRRQLRG